VEIGEILKKAREVKKWSLRDAADHSGLSPSFISAVERNETSPSMRSLKSLTDALDIRLTDVVKYFEQEETSNSPLITPEMRRRINQVFPGVQMYVLSPETNDSLQALMIIAEPGGSTGEGDFRHEGEEFAFLLSGTLWIKIGDTEYNLRQGDSISFKSSTPHRWENRGVLPSICLWVLTPPSW
jgi:transcriptional regulator with XRE-family HTH domain